MSDLSTEDRMKILLDVDVLLTKYSDNNGRYRPSIPDYATYNALQEMYESDMDESEPYIVWTVTPDVVMESIIDSHSVFTTDFGWEDFSDGIRDYLTENGFVVHSDDLEEDEYQQLLEGRK